VCTAQSGEAFPGEIALKIFVHVKNPLTEDVFGRDFAFIFLVDIEVHGNRKPAMLAGFPEGRIVPCLCAEGTRTLCPHAESRRAQTVMSRRDIAEINGAQLLYFQ
jgi:hypothetical protein